LTYYDPSILAAYLQLPKDLDPRIAVLSRLITANAPTMLDKVQALETYLHTNFTYDVNVNLPPGQEGVLWFLFSGNHRGFCNYFSTTMAVMARTLGIPSRVVAGYTNGRSDPAHHDHIIYGTDAHSWTQIYFAGYGWINFEPSASFSPFERPYPGQYQQGTTGLIPVGGITPNPGRNRKLIRNEAADTGGPTSANTSVQFAAQLRQQASIAFGAVVLLILVSLLLFNIWWRRLFRNYRLSTQIFGRICILANWAGIPLKYSQTPNEFVKTLAIAAPGETATLEHFGDIYTRELWANPDSADHPRNSGEINELSRLWQRLQPRFFFYMLKHPYVLAVLPRRAWKSVRQLWVKRRARRALEQDW